MMYRTKEADPQTTIAVLNRLVIMCEESTHGFRLAAESLTSGLLTTLLAHYARQRLHFAIALRAEVRRQGGKPCRGSSPPCATDGDGVYRGEVLRQGSSRAILKECERSEAHTVQTYESALRSGLPADVVAMIQRQYQEIHLVYRNICRVAQRVETILDHEQGPHRQGVY
jgi:uncharacterized protein (TIGR02284 family)